MAVWTSAEIEDWGAGVVAQPVIASSARAEAVSRPGLIVTIETSPSVRVLFVPLMQMIMTCNRGNLRITDFLRVRIILMI